MKKKKKRLFLLCIILTLMLTYSAPALAFDLTDAGSYTNLQGTVLYVSPDIKGCEKEMNQIVKEYKRIPEQIRNMLKFYNIRFYLTYDMLYEDDELYDVPDIKVTEDSPDLIPIEIDNPNYTGPAFVEKDPYDLNNCKKITRQGQPAILWHGYYVLFQTEEQRDEAFPKMQKTYMDSASEYGEVIIAKLKEERKERENMRMYGGPDRTAAALSHSPEYEYFVDTGEFSRIVTDGYMEYFLDNPLGVTPDSVIHESAHFMDWLYVLETGYQGTIFGITDRPDWIAVYEAEKDILAQFDEVASINVLKDAHEGFCEAFRQYCTDPDRLSDSCPAMYSYMQTALSWFDKYDWHNFDTEFYTANAPDIKENLGTDVSVLFKHWQDFGWKEKRQVRFTEPGK